MSFTLPVKVDATTAQSSIEKFGATVAQTETKMTATERAAAALGKSLAGMVSNMKTDAMTSASKAFSGLNDQFKREADILEKIRGPQREYIADLKALDMLLQKNTISTKEYAEQVTRLNQGIEKTSSGGGEGGKGGGHESVLAFAGGMIAEGALTEAAHKIAEMVEETNQLKDGWIEASNAAEKFADAGHSVNTVIGDQLELAHDLHQKLGPTIDLYDQVRDGTDNMNLSYAEQIRLTRTLSESSQLAGKSGSLSMERLSYMFSTGKVELMTLNSVMRKVPEIGDAWTKSFGVSRATLLQMAADGKISVQDLAGALYKAGIATEELDRNYKKLQRTNEQITGEFVDRTKLTMGRDGSNVVNAMAANMMHDAGFRSPKETEQEETQRFQSLITNIKEARGEWRFLNDIVTEGGKRFAEALDTVPGMFDEINSKIRTVGSTFGLITDKWDQSIGDFGRSLKVGMDSAGKIGAAKQDLEALKAAHAAGTIGANEYNAAYKSLVTTINGGVLPASIKIWEEITVPMKTYRADLAALNALWHEGADWAEKYDDELASIEKRRPGEHLEDELKRATDAWVKLAIAARDAKAVGVTLPSAVGLTGHNFAGAERQAMADAKQAKEFDTYAQKQMDEREKYELQFEDWKQNQRTEEFKREVSDYKRHVDDLKGALKPLQDAFLNLFQTGKFGWNSMLDSMLLALEQKLVNQGGAELAGLLASAFGSGGGSGPLDYVQNGVHSNVPLTNPNNPFNPPTGRMAPSGGSQPGGVTVIVQSDPSMMIPGMQTPGGNQVIATVSDKRAATQARLRAPR